MSGTDVEVIIQRVGEKFPGVCPRIITDNDPQFVARDFKELVRLSGMSDVKTSRCYTQSSGKLERWQASLKHECIMMGRVDDSVHMASGCMQRCSFGKLKGGGSHDCPAGDLQADETDLVRSQLSSHGYQLPSRRIDRFERTGRDRDTR